MRFEDADLFEQLEAATPSEINALPFGVVRMNLEGVVELYNVFESELSGLSIDKVVGKHFFTQVALCTNNFMVAYRFEESDDLEACVDYMFTFKIRPTTVRLRLLKKAAHGRQYLVVRK